MSTPMQSNAQTSRYRNDMRLLDDKLGVLAPRGFRAAGVHSGVKRKRNDIALIVSDTPAVAAGVFTQNIVRAHCVTLNQERLQSGQGTARALIVNSGNANACNGDTGMADALRMTSLVEQRLSLPQGSVLNASTGVIGVALPMDKIEPGIEAACNALHAGDNAEDVADGILTTDTYRKLFAVEITLTGGSVVRIGSISKGSGMIAPNMATMLGFITTDAAIEQPVLQEMLARCAWHTFNSVTVDGDTSTNDMAIVLANGQAGNAPITGIDTQDANLFETALYNVCLHHAREIARDGEGATKLIEVRVHGVAPPKALVDAYHATGMPLTPEQRMGFARSVAKTVATSPLVKTALFGNDPNWGRILAAVGRSGVQFDPAEIEITLAGHKLYTAGKPTEFNGYVVSDAMNKKDVAIEIDLHQEHGESATVWTCDFSYDYVKINAEYHT